MSLVGKEIMAMKKALITGIAGQDGSYLAEFLLQKGYEVHGFVRENPLDKRGGYSRLNSIVGQITLHSGDVSNRSVVEEMVKIIKFDEIYHLATFHDLPNNLENYTSIIPVNINSTYYFLSAIKLFNPTTKMFFASSCKVFGNPLVSPQNEETRFAPNSLYGISKVAAGALVTMYREKEGLFACSGILYNHESPRRDPEYLSKKISLGVAGIKKGTIEKIAIGDIHATRDWGFAGDYVEAMWLMLQQDIATDYVIGTGEVHSVEDFLNTAFGVVDLDWKKFVNIDPSLTRRSESEFRADITKARTKLGWQPTMKFKELVTMMVEEDLKATQ